MIYLKLSTKYGMRGLIYKLRRHGICGNLLQLLISFLDSTKKRILLNGQCSSQGFINAGVPQGLILGPLLFLIYINDLTENLIIIIIIPYNNSFQQRLEPLQYKTSLAITGAIKGSSTERLYQELGLESLQTRQWFRKLSVFYNIVKEQSPKQFI